MWNCVNVTHGELFIFLYQGTGTVLLTLAPGVPFSPLMPESPYNKTQQRRNIISKMNNIIYQYQILTVHLVKCIQILTVTPFGPGMPGIPASP